MLCHVESNLSSMSTTYGARLDTALRLAKTDRQTLADQLGISVQAIGQVIAGKTKALTAENSAQAARVLGVDGYWLATGEGAVGSAKPAAAKASASIWPFARIREADVLALSEGDRNFVEGAIALAVAQAGMNLTVASPGVAERNNDPSGHILPASIEAANDPDYIAIRKMQIKISAGVAGYSIDPEEDQGGGGLVFLPRSWVELRHFSAHALFATSTRGMSMFPRVHEGDTIVVNTADSRQRHGEVFAVNHEGEFTIKRLQRRVNHWWLYSDNPDQTSFPPVMCTERTQMIGKVVLLQAEEL